MLVHSWLNIGKQENNVFWEGVCTSERLRVYDVHNQQDRRPSSWERYPAYI